MKIRDFDELPIATDGKVLVGASGTICTTDSNLSDIIGDLIVPATSGKVDKTTYAEDKAAIEQDIAEIGTSLDTKLDTTAFNAAVSVIDENLESLGGDLDGLDDKIDAVSGIVASDYALSADVSTALTGKEDKVFVAEYGVTTYQEIETAYNAGKQIVCKYRNSMEDKYTYFNYYFKMSGYEVFSFYVVSCSVAAGIGTTYSCSKSEGWTKRETKLQGELTFAGENDTITAINTSAVGQTLAAGTDLVINNGVIGVNTNGTVAGENAFVEGNNTSAIGYGSHAEGGNTIAYGTFAHAEGQSTSAVMGAHSEGYNTIASGNFSHAEGLNNITLKDGSHAEGQNTSAIDFFSHSEGISTIAKGKASHAGGMSAIAEGSASFAHGRIVSAIGDYSVAFGYQSVASGDYSFVEGNYNKAIGEKSHAEGNSTIASGSYSHAEGDGTRANSYSDHAEGNGTTAEGGYSHAEGYSTKAAGGRSHAEGEYTNALSVDSHAEGYMTSADGTAAHAEGYCTLAIGPEAHAEGFYSLANGSYTHAEGNATSAYGEAARAAGSRSVANGQCASVEGYENIAYSFAHAEGGNTSAYGTASHTEGTGTSAIGAASHAEGLRTLASGDYSHAGGNESVASGSAGFAHGYHVSAIGENGSFAEGLHTLASGNYSHAEGCETIAGSDYMHAGGKYNATTADALFVIGNGTYNARNDAFIVSGNGTISATNIMTSGINVASYISQLESTVTSLSNLINSYSGRWVLTPADTRLIIDGKAYNTIVMPDGNEWMTENLMSDSVGGIWYNNDVSVYGSAFGKLYTFNEIQNMTMPTGWELPTKSDWENLLASINNDSLKLRAGIWIYNGSPIETTGTDDYGFSLLAGGFASQYVNSDTPSFNAIRQKGVYMTNTYDSQAYYPYQTYTDRDGIVQDYFPTFNTVNYIYRCSVRLVKKHV